MKIPVEEELLRTLQATLEAVRIELENVRKMAKGNDPFSVQEATEYLKVSRPTLQQYINSGQIEISQYGNRIWLIRSELDSFLSRHRHKVRR